MFFKLDFGHYFHMKPWEMGRLYTNEYLSMAMSIAHMDK